MFTSVGSPVSRAFQIDRRHVLTVSLANAERKLERHTLAVDLINNWINRRVGDQQAGAVPYTFTSVKTYQADAPLPASGLLGPVKLEAVTTRD